MKPEIPLKVLKEINRIMKELNGNQDLSLTEKCYIFKLGYTLYENQHNNLLMKQYYKPEEKE